MNRILPWLKPACPCAEASETLAALRTEVERLQALVDGVVEYDVPSMARYLDGNRTISLWLSAELADAEIGDNLAALTVAELRTMASRMLDAADAIEKGGAA